MPRPTDVAGVRRVLGMVNYLSRFKGDLADLCLPLRQLTHRDVEWEWSHDHEQAFERLKTVMSEVPVLQYFDPAAAITVQCDASSTGIRAALLQEGRPVVYASRALTPTECHYAQIEKEVLAIVFGLERFHYYTYGVPVTSHSRW